MKLRSSGLIAIILLAGSITPAQQAAPRPITVDDLFGVKEAHEARFSPDGQAIAFTVNSSSLKEDKQESRIWMLPTAGGEPSLSPPKASRPLTRAGHRMESIWRFSPRARMPRETTRRRRSTY